MTHLGPQEIRRILAVTDALAIHRESVRVPLARRDAGSVRLAGAGQIEIVAPAAGDFEAWLAALPERIRELDLAGVRRVV